MNGIKVGDRIEWWYMHSTGRTRFPRKRVGIYYGMQRHTYKHWRKHGAKQMAVVHFDGNKRSSRVPFEGLLKVKNA